MCESIVEARCAHCVHVVARFEHYVCVWRLGVNMCVYMWRLEANLQGVPLLLSPLIFETEPLTELRPQIG